MKFKHKVIKCEPEQVWKVCDEYRDQWIVALLTRMKVDPDKIDRIQNDPKFSKRAWRNELFFKHGIEVSKHPDKIIIKRYQDEAEDIILGEWRNPEIVRIKDKSGRKRHCEVRLDYWQLV